MQVIWFVAYLWFLERLGFAGCYYGSCIVGTAVISGSATVVGWRRNPSLAPTVANKIGKYGPRAAPRLDWVVGMAGTVRWYSEVW